MYIYAERRQENPWISDERLGIENLGTFQPFGTIYIYRNKIKYCKPQIIHFAVFRDSCGKKGGFDPTVDALIIPTSSRFGATGAR
jgi:hypothetical protein